MKHKNLRKHIIRLAELNNESTPMISAFFNLKKVRENHFSDFLAWAKIEQQQFKGESLDLFRSAIAAILHYLKTAKGQSASCHVRLDREHSFQEFVSYQAKLEENYYLENYPIIYPLVELKDTFKRFVLVTTTAEKARIIELSIGTPSLKAISERKDPSRKSGKEWSREHYQNHIKERSKHFVKEKVAIIEQVCAERSHDAIILAGEPRYVKRLKSALPLHLQRLVIDEIQTGIQDSRLQEVLLQAVECYVKTEAEESLSAVYQLCRSYGAHGLASLGVEETFKALQRHQADKLIISSQLPAKIRETLVHLATKQDIEIETVKNR